MGRSSALVGYGAWLTVGRGHTTYTVVQPTADDAPKPKPSVLGGRIKRVAAASAVAQVVGESVSLVQTVVVARLLSPAEVGLFAAGTVLTAFLTEFQEGGLRSALVNRQKDVPAAAETVFWATFINGLVMSLGALLAAPVIGLIFNSSTAGVIAAASAGGLVIYSLANVPEAFLQREFSVRRRLIVGPLVSMSFAGVTITLAALGFGVWSLLIGTYASFLTQTCAVWLLHPWRPGTARASFALWREMARFGFPLIAGTFTSKVRQFIEAVVVGRMLTTTALGYYRYGLRIARVPANAMIEVVAYALFPAFSRMADDPLRMRGAYVRALGWVTFCAAPVTGILVAIGEPMAVVVLGEPWRGAGIAVVAMGGLGLGKAFASVSEEAIKGAGRTSLINRFTVTELVIGLALLTLVIPWGLVGVGVGISLTALVVGVQCVVTARRVLGASNGDVLRAVVPPVLAAAAAAGVTYLVETSVMHSDARPVLVGVSFLLLDGLICLVAYLAVFAALAPRTVRVIASALRRRIGRR